MKLDREQVRHLALLAELSLTEKEESRLAAELDRIVGYVAELDAVDTSGIPPMQGPIPTIPRFREDSVQPGIAHDDALASAPRAEHGGFVVPTFVE